MISDHIPIGDHDRDLDHFFDDLPTHCQDLNKHIVVTRMSMRSGPGRRHKLPVQPHYGHRIGKTLGHKVSSSFFVCFRIFSRYGSAGGCTGL